MPAKGRLWSGLSRWARAVRWRVWLWRARWALVVVAPLVLLNVLVAVCGRTVVFPLSLSYLRPKAIALGRYALHRPHCLGIGHAPIGPLITHAETKHRLPRALLAAVVEVESNGRAHRISPAGAMGPAQLTHATARVLGVDDPFDSAQNLDGAARYLGRQLSHFHDVRLAVAAYNAGPGSIVARTVPRNGETEIYVERVMRIYQRLRPPPPPRVTTHRRPARTADGTEAEPPRPKVMREAPHAQRRPPGEPSPHRAAPPVRERMRPRKATARPASQNAATAEPR